MTGFKYRNAICAPSAPECTHAILHLIAGMPQIFLRKPRRPSKTALAKHEWARESCSNADPD